MFVIVLSSSLSLELNSVLHNSMSTLCTRWPLLFLFHQLSSFFIRRMLLFFKTSLLRLFLLLGGVHGFSVSPPIRQGLSPSTRCNISARKETSLVSKICFINTAEKAAANPWREEQQKVHSSEKKTSNLFKMKSSSAISNQIPGVKQTLKKASRLIKPYIHEMAIFLGKKLYKKPRNQDYRICDTTSMDDELLSNLMKETTEFYQNMNEVTEAISKFTPAWDVAEEATQYDRGLRVR